ncbi:hypothetical protein LCGC14_2623800 [marine sediment metagenome]|uniref:Uncharacterized protein n=1 Tax=marine sediment metagenome TaxID=412755 RepID=A0A0F9CUS6_9ZZZZ
MKNVRIKLREDCSGIWFDFCLYEGRKWLADFQGCWVIKKAAIRNAKAMAKRIGIPYDSEIIKQKGC